MRGRGVSLLARFLESVESFHPLFEAFVLIGNKVGVEGYRYKSYGY